MSYKFTLTDEDFLDLVDTAGGGIHYWVSAAKVSKSKLTYTITEFDTDKIFCITKAQLEQIIVNVVEKKSYQGDIQESIELLAQVGLSDAAHMIDAEVVDVLIQEVCFGELVYS